MPIDPTRLKQLIAARRFEDVGRRLQEASAADLAAIPTQGLLEYLESLSDSARRMVPDSVLDNAVIELVDLPPAELVQRLHEGKVYLPDRAAVADRDGEDRP